MEAKLLSQHRSDVPCVIRAGLKVNQKPESSSVILPVLARPADTMTKFSDPGNAYKDSWLDLIAINHLSQSLQSTIGIRNNKSGYDSLVEAAVAAAQSFNPIEQHAVVIGSLERAFPPPILSLIRALVPQSKFAREFFAVFTTFFFTWLVGHCQVEGLQFRRPTEDCKSYEPLISFSKVKGTAYWTAVLHWSSRCSPATASSYFNHRAVLPDAVPAPKLTHSTASIRFARGEATNVKKSEKGGKTERNVVHIKKCRFLEETKCIGMCINLCKMPSQSFIKDSLGMPVNMVPKLEKKLTLVTYRMSLIKEDFEDMSCEMIFGEDPPAPSDDPALKQPCYKMPCKAKQKHSRITPAS